MLNFEDKAAVCPTCGDRIKNGFGFMDEGQIYCDGLCALAGLAAMKVALVKSLRELGQKRETLDRIRQTR